MPTEKSKLNLLDVLDDVRKSLVERLEKRREQICAEISDYPPPIPACDAQFNYLLEARRGIAGELARLNDSRTAARSDDELMESIERLIDESAYLDEDARRELRSRLKQPQ